MAKVVPLERFAPPDEGTAVALGFFDGVHRGHLALIERVLGGPEAPVVLTFRNHPASVVSHADLPPLLTDFEERCQLLMQAGLDVVWTDFDRPFSQLEPQRFVDDILVARLGARRVVSGDNYRFGHRAAGNPAFLANCQDFQVEIVAAVLDGGQVISSSRIRACLTEGRVDEAQRLLGRPFRISGRVLRGEQIGRKLDAPTANLALETEKAIPLYGVYAVRVQHKGVSYPAVANLGVRPTAQEFQKSPLLEVHLLDFAGDIYGEPLQVDFRVRLRGEQRFPNLDALKAQIQQDIVRARQLLT